MTVALTVVPRRLCGVLPRLPARPLIASLPLRAPSYASPASAHSMQRQRVATVMVARSRIAGAAQIAPHGSSGVGRFQLLARWPGTHSRILSGIQRAAQTVVGVYLKRTCSRVTSASTALGVLNDYALYKSTHSLLGFTQVCN